MIIVLVPPTAGSKGNRTRLIFCSGNSFYWLSEKESRVEGKIVLKDCEKRAALNALSFDPDVFLRHPAFGGRRSAGPKGRMNPALWLASNQTT